MITAFFIITRRLAIRITVLRCVIIFVPTIIPPIILFGVVGEEGVKRIKFGFRLGLSMRCTNQIRTGIRFDQAIFLLREGAGPVSDEALLREAKGCLEVPGRGRRKAALSGPLWAAAGAGIACLLNMLL